jgi:anaerobic dimethyl sulfoxide reductase subunit A
VEFSVCHDLFLTPTARYCDIVLPVTHWLERDDIVFPGMNYLFYSSQAVDPHPNVKNDWDIFCELAGRLGFYEAFTENRSPRQWLDHLLEHSEVVDPDRFLSTGIYEGKEQERVGLSQYITDPETHPLSTPSGKIELCSDRYAETGYPACPQPRIAVPTTDFPLRMITPHALLRINSTYWNMEWTHRGQQHAIWVHPDDADTRGIRNGETVYVESENGSMYIEAFVTERIMRGVVCVFQGAWCSLDALSVDRAGSANILTSTVPTLPSNGSRTHSTFVEVWSVNGDRSGLSRHAES